MCGATYVVQFAWCIIRGVIYAVRAMLRDLCRAIHVGQCKAAHSNAQKNQSNAKQDMRCDLTAATKAATSQRQRPHSRQTEGTAQTTGGDKASTGRRRGVDG
eukprot:7494864-Pyramimonas_sp.AAC.1